MAATISIGTATGVVDLCQKLDSWLQTRGWTSNMSQAEDNGWRCHVSKGGVFVNLFGVANNVQKVWDLVSIQANNYALDLFLGSGFSGSSAFKDQPGGPQYITGGTVGCGAVIQNAAVTSYQFIDDGYDNIFVLIETSPGTYRHLYWGTLTKIGSWTGGQYFGGSTCGQRADVYYGPDNVANMCPFSEGDITGNNAACFVRADIDTFTSKWICGNSTSSKLSNPGATGKSLASGIYYSSNTPTADVPRISLELQAKMHSSLSGRIFTHPITIYAERDAGGYSAIGIVPTIRFCNAYTYGMTVGTDVQLGPETWRVFAGFAVRVA